MLSVKGNLGAGIWFLEFHHGNYVCKQELQCECGSVLVSLPGLAVFISENNVFCRAFPFRMKASSFLKKIKRATEM